MAENTSAADQKQPVQAVAQDQDTVIGDALISAAQIVYDMATAVARKIAENAQYAIDLDEIHKAELALAYMQGVDFGLAMDVKDHLVYLAYMEKCLASVRKSRDAGFQFQIYVPPNPFEFLGADEDHCRAVGITFIHALSKCPPSEKFIKELEDEALIDKGLDPNKFIQSKDDPECLVHAPLNGPDPDDAETIDDGDDSHAEDSAVKKDDKEPRKAGKGRLFNAAELRRRAKIAEAMADFKAEVAKTLKGITKEHHEFVFSDLTLDRHGEMIVIGFSLPGTTKDERRKNGKEVLRLIKDSGLSVEKSGIIGPGDSWMLVGVRIAPQPKAEDGIKEVRTLKTLYRTHRINKSAFKGGMATLLAAGLISKADYYASISDPEFS